MQLFLYFGHGHGQQYLSAEFNVTAEHCASSLLMGCSSGAIAVQGMYKPKCAPYAYIHAGCTAAIANLWDVTDREIDRFSEEVLHQWTSSTALAFSKPMADARKATRLPFLTGAAPVCFGVPVSVTNS